MHPSPYGIEHHPDIAFSSNQDLSMHDAPRGDAEARGLVSSTRDSAARLKGPRLHARRKAQFGMQNNRATASRGFRVSFDADGARNEQPRGPQAPQKYRTPGDSPRQALGARAMSERPLQYQPGALHSRSARSG